MTKFKHKTTGTVVIAMQFEYGFQMSVPRPDQDGRMISVSVLHYQDASNPRVPVVLDTVEGQHLLRQGEWILTVEGQRGEGTQIYVPMSDVEFKANYEPT